MTTESQSEAVVHGTPWGVVVTIFFFVLVSAVYMLLQRAAMWVIARWTIPSSVHGAYARQIAEMGHYGDMVTFGVLVSVFGGGALLALLIRARRGISLTEYLAWRRVPFRQIGISIAFLVLYEVVWELLTAYMGHAQTPAFIETAYRTAHFLPLLWFSVIVAAPLFEESFFRGFLFTGIAASRLGAAGAIILTAVFWAGLHLEYDLYDMTSVFVLGLLFGVVRYRTGSLWPTLSMHMLANFVAMVETAAKLMR